jgi:predicted DNA-binding transcriptional regulator AlpA
MDTKYQTVTQAAEQSGYTRSWIHLLIKDKRVPGAKRMGTIWLVPRPLKYISKKT